MNWLQRLAQALRPQPVQSAVLKRSEGRNEEAHRLLMAQLRRTQERLTHDGR